MHCVQFETRLNDLLDEREPPGDDRQLIEHARRCDECADLLAGHEMLLADLQSLACAGSLDGPRTLRRPAAPVDFSLRVALAVADERRAARRNGWFWLIPALAASLLVAVVAWRNLGAAFSGARPTAETMAHAATPVTPSAVRHPGDIPQATPLTSVIAAQLPSYPWTGMRTDQISQGLTDSVEHLADGLKPVTDSMSAALQALRRTLPGAEPAVRSSWIGAGQEWLI